MSREEQSDVDTQKQHIVIAGAGVIGLSTAYYLQKNHNVKSITLIDPTGEIAPAASGKAGGFLAKDWNDYGPTAQLTHRSFDLHQELANELSASDIQYRRLTCAAISVDPYGMMNRPKGKKLSTVEWAAGDNDNGAVLGMRPLGDESTIAQVHPKKLCQRMWDEICKNVPNATLVKGRVTGAVHSQEDGNLLGAKLSDGKVVKGDAILFACGPWSADIVTGIKYHSVVVPTETVLSQCVFFSGCGDPEVYVRPDSTAYCTGFPEPERRVTERPGEESIDDTKVATILKSVKDACGQNDDSSKSQARPALQTENPAIQQSCYLPSTPDGVPAIGALPECGKNCYIATGHSCWGILLAPATGESVASIMMTGKETEYVDLSPFRPSRFGSFKLVP